MPLELEFPPRLDYSPVQYERSMQFLKTLAWILVAVLVAIVAGNNWRDVTINLWSNLQVDIKIPMLLLVVFLLGFLPTWLVMRGKIWRIQRRIAVDVPPIPAAPAPPYERNI